MEQQMRRCVDPENFDDFSTFEIRFHPLFSIFMLTLMPIVILVFAALSALSLLIFPQSIVTALDSGDSDALIIIAYTPLIILFTAMLSIGFLGIALRLIRNQPYLVISRSGVEGFGWVRWRQVAWSEIDRIEATHNYCVFMIKPRTAIGRLLRTVSLGLLSQKIGILFLGLTERRTRILAAIRHYSGRNW